LCPLKEGQAFKRGAHPRERKKQTFAVEEAGKSLVQQNQKKSEKGAKGENKNHVAANKQRGEGGGGGGGGGTLQQIKGQRLIGSVSKTGKKKKDLSTWRRKEENAETSGGQQHPTSVHGERKKGNNPSVSCPGETKKKGGKSRYRRPRRKVLGDASSIRREGKKTHLNDTTYNEERKEGGRQKKGRGW